MCTSAPRCEGERDGPGERREGLAGEGSKSSNNGRRGAGRCTRGAERGSQIGTASGSGRAAERAGPGRAWWKPLECAGLWGRDRGGDGEGGRPGRSHVSQACSSFLVPAGGEPGPVRMPVLQIPILYYFVFEFCILYGLYPAMKCTVPRLRPCLCFCGF
jgi:hypothetical protein